MSNYRIRSFREKSSHSIVNTSIFDARIERIRIPCQERDHRHIVIREEPKQVKAEMAQLSPASMPILPWVEFRQAPALAARFFAY